MAPKEPSWSFRYRFGDGAFADRPLKVPKNPPAGVNLLEFPQVNEKLRKVVWHEESGWESNFKGKDPE